jgi:hypothetical protein
MTTKNLYPNSVPSLDLNFAKLKRLDPRVTFTRASTGTYVGADGLIKTAGNGVARFDHSATGESLGLLLEEARTNYLFAYASPNYNTSSAAVYSTYSDSQFGAAENAHSWTWPSAAGAILLGWINPGSVSTTGNGVQYVISFWAKANQVYTMNGNVQDERRQAVNFAASLTTSWQYFSFSTPAGIADDGSGTVYFFWFRGAPNTAIPAGLRIDFAAVNLERGGFPTSYIPTAGSTVTRAADVATVSNTGSSVFPTSAFTTVNSPFGTAGGGTTVKLVGPTIKRTAVYNGDLTQTQINALAGVNDGFWRWRVLGSSFALPSFTTNGSVTVDWGDGVVETLTTAVHTFTNGGGYHDIGFRLNSGTFFRPSINGNSTYGPRVIAVGPAPASMKVDADSAFYGCGASLKCFDATVDVTGGTNLVNAWFSCSSLTSFPLINTAAVTNFLQAWYGCSSLTSFPLIDTAAGTNFSTAWYNCSSLTSFPLINTAAGTNFQNAWTGCSNLTSFPLINTAAGTNFYQTWYGCSNLTSFPLINTAAGTNFQSTWQGLSLLTSFPLVDTSAGTNFRQTWYGCSGLTSFPANMFNATGTLVATAFTDAFFGCALTATSIENILTSLVTNGQSNITLTLSGGTNANTSTWSAAAKYAYLTLIARGWTITQNGTAPTDADAYITAVEAADGQALEAGVKTAINDFVTGCKADGIWNSIKASCILAGARTLSGALVPLVGTAPTNFNFASGDYNRKTGLVGNGSTKYLDSNRNNNADPQNSQHMAVYVSSFVVSPGGYRGFIGGGDNQTGSSNLFVNGTTNILDSRSRYLAPAIRALGAALSPGITGLSRNTSASYVVRANGSNTTAVYTSQAPSNINVWVFTANNNGTPAVPTASRLAFYSIGESVDLALLDARVTALITAYDAAIP